jgi:hypothetical protein
MNRDATGQAKPNLRSLFAATISYRLADEPDGRFEFTP